MVDSTNGRTIRTETRKRGFMGHVFKWLFIGFNLFMAWAFFEGVSDASHSIETADSEAGRAGATVGTVLGATMIMIFWAGGTLILGLFVLLTRGRKIIVEERAG